jgi:hypothetical protein
MVIIIPEEEQRISLIILNNYQLEDSIFDQKPTEYFYLSLVPEFERLPRTFEISKKKIKK